MKKETIKAVKPTISVVKANSSSFACASGTCHCSA